MTASRSSLRPLTALVLFGGSFASFLRALTGTVPSYRDSGDLISSAVTLGIAHPPGYPAYVLTTKLFLGLMPIGNAAYRANIWSALLAAAAVALIFYTLVHDSGNEDRLPLRMLAAAVPALLYARSPALWDLARVAEMYTLAALFAAAILWLTGSKGKLLAAIFCFTVGLTVHPTLIFLLPVLIAAFQDEDPVRRPGLGLAIGIALLGGSVILFLPLRSASFPWADWGHPASLHNLWRVLVRADYGGLKLHPEQSHLSWTPQSFADQLRYFVVSFVHEWGGPALAAGLWGWTVGLRGPNARRWQGLLASFVLAGPVFFLLSNLPLQEATTPAILEPYLLLPGLLWALALCAALAAGWRRSAILGAALTALVLLPLGRTSPSSRTDFYAYDYGRDLMRSLPMQAALFDPDDSTAFSLMTLQATEHRRSDLAFLSFFRTRWGYEQIVRRYPEMLPGFPLQNAADLQKAIWTYGIKKRPIFGELPQKLAPIPSHAQGLVYAADPSFTGGRDPLSHARGEQLFTLYGARGPMKTRGKQDFFTRHLLDFYAAAHSNLGLAYAQDTLFDEAVRQYKESLRIDPELSAAWNNWGVVEFNRKHFPAAVTLFKRAAAGEPANEGFRRNLEMAQNQAGK